MRLFIAILLSDDIRAALGKVQASLDGACRGVRWIPENQLHLTAKFLGEVPDRNVAEVAEAVARAAADAAPFDMEIAGCGCFPPRGPVRIVWVGVEEASGALLRCVEAVEGRLEEKGFPKERRPFSAHITIGRVREDRSGGRLRSVAEACTFEPMEQPVPSLTLMSSVLSPKGPTYTAVSTTSLGEARPGVDHGS